MPPPSGGRGGFISSYTGWNGIAAVGLLLFLAAVLSGVAGGSKTAVFQQVEDDPTLSILFDINSADRGELETLPGIGAVLADRILRERENGPYRSVGDLERVRGIGPGTVKELESYVTSGGGQ